MKYYMLFMVFFASSVLSHGEFSTKGVSKKEFSKKELSKELKTWSEVTLREVHAGGHRSDDRKKFELLKIVTSQNKEDVLEYEMSDFRIRVAAEVSVARSKTKYLVEFEGNPSEDYREEYLGEDYWYLYIPHGDLGRLSVTASAVQYGYMDKNTDTFIILDERYDHVRSKTMEELTSRSDTTPFPGKVFMRHHYMYADPSSGAQESSPYSVRAIKE